MVCTRTSIVLALATLLIVPASILSGGCESLPGSRTEQSTVIGGASGAAIGAILAKENRLLGALIGGAIGAGGGYLIGAKTDWFEGDKKDEATQEARQAARKAQDSPATAAQARDALTADINDDGFVTLDEVIAMDRAGFSDGKMLDRLRATGQVFDLNDAQEEYLRENGVSENVIRELVRINRAERDRLIDESAARGGRGSEVISGERE